MVEKKNILVLCQRKFSDMKTEYVENTVKNIKDFVYRNFNINESNTRFKFLSSGFSDEYGTRYVDVDMHFDMHKTETRSWVDKHIKTFDIVILNTCPFCMITLPSWYGLWKIMKKDASLFAMSISDKSERSVLKSILFPTKKGLSGLDNRTKKLVYYLFDFKKDSERLISKQIDIYDFISHMLEDCTTNIILELYNIMPEDLREFIQEISVIIIHNSDNYNEDIKNTAQTILLGNYF